MFLLVPFHHVHTTNILVNRPRTPLFPRTSFPLTGCSLTVIMHLARSSIPTIADIYRQRLNTYTLSGQIDEQMTVNYKKISYFPNL